MLSRSYRERSCSTDFGEDDFGQRFPEIALRSIIMLLDVVEDRMLQLSHAFKRAASQALLPQIPKPASTKFR
ncbi:MAG: hypothetical protein C0483_24320 [Pirellula sp.]|nr:hypothetical protein [Pirellula sp.]